MLNIIFNIIIFLICSALGYIIAQEYRCRVVNLQSFVDGLKSLEDEIRYRKTPLPEALRIVSKEKTGEIAQILFANVSAGLKGKGSLSFMEVWNEHLAALKETSALKEEDIRVITELGKGLGGTDLYGQSSVIQRTCKQIEEQLATAVLENNTKGKMYRGLGIALGLTIVIILI